LDVQVIPITTANYPIPARRPQYSVLDNYLLKLEGLNIMRKWKEAFDDFTNRYRNELLKGEH